MCSVSWEFLMFDHSHFTSLGSIFMLQIEWNISAVEADVSLHIYCSRNQTINQKFQGTKTIRDKHSIPLNGAHLFRRAVPKLSALHGESTGITNCQMHGCLFHTLGNNEAEPMGCWEISSREKQKNSFDLSCFPVSVVSVLPAPRPRPMSITSVTSLNTEVGKHRHNTHIPLQAGTLPVKTFRLAFLWSGKQKIMLRDVLLVNWLNLILVEMQGGSFFQSW